MNRKSGNKKPVSITNLMTYKVPKKEPKIFTYEYKNSRKQNSKPKTNIKVKNLEEQLKYKNQRIKQLNELRARQQKQCLGKKKDEPTLADDLFLDIFSIFKLGM